MEREERLTRAVEQYGQELLRYCHHILCDYHEAQDAVQTAFLKAWERAGSLPHGEELWRWRPAWRRSLWWAPLRWS